MPRGGPATRVERRENPPWASQPVPTPLAAVDSLELPLATLGWELESESVTGGIVARGGNTVAPRRSPVEADSANPTDTRRFNWPPRDDEVQVIELETGKA